MQNIRQMNHGVKSAMTGICWAYRCTIVCFFATMLCFFAMLFISPDPAFAAEGFESSEYSILETSISSDIQTDGSLHVTEQRLFHFEPGRTKICWKTDIVGGSIDIQGVYVAQMSAPDQEGIELTPLSKSVFNVNWRKEGGPEGGVYSFDVENKSTYAFFDVTDSYVLMKYEYILPNAVAVYNDCAELDWKYVKSGQWASDSENVSCVISFPVPYEEWPVVGEDVYAWCHGPDGSALSFDESVNSVSFWQERVGSDEYAEARLLIPAGWISNASKGVLSHSKEVHKDSVLEEEQEWVDWKNVVMVDKLRAQIAFGIVSLALVLIALILFAIFGKNRKAVPDQDGENLLDQNIHPVLVGRLWRWNRPAPSDFVSTILHLRDLGALSIGYQDRSEDDSEEGKAAITRAYYLSETGDVSRESLCDIDEYAMYFIFDVVGKGERSVWVDSIADYAEEYVREYSESIDSWQDLVACEVSAQGYFEREGLFLQKAIAGAGMLYLAAMIVASIAMKSVWLIMFGIVTAAVMYCISNLMGRRSVRGSAAYKVCQDLREWLLNLGSQEGIAEMSLEEWQPLMECAYQLDVAPQVVSQLRDLKSCVLAREESLEGTNPGYVAWHKLYWSEDEQVIPICLQLEQILIEAQEKAEWSLKRELNSTLASIRKIGKRLCRKK